MNLIMTKWKDRNDFKAAVHAWGEKLEIKIVSVSMRPMKNKWASCSTSGNLNFNDDLLDMDRKLGEYVILHELMHLRTPNHGALWKSYMSAYMPEWEKFDIELKKLAVKEV